MIIDLLETELRSLGANRKDISIRRKHGGSSASFTVTIRNPKFNYNAVKKICKKYEKINWCPYTDEILSGGNTFISIVIDNKGKDILFNQYLESCQSAFDQADYGNSYQYVMGTTVLIGNKKGEHPFQYAELREKNSIFSPSHVQDGQDICLILYKAGLIIATGDNKLLKRSL